MSRTTGAIHLIPLPGPSPRGPPYRPDNTRRSPRTAAFGVELSPSERQTKQRVQRGQRRPVSTAVQAHWELSGTKTTHSTGGFSVESPQGWVRIKGTLTCFRTLALIGAQQVSENSGRGARPVRAAVLRRKPCPPPSAPETGGDAPLLQLCSPPAVVPCALVKHPRATLLNKQQREKQS